MPDSRSVQRLPSAAAAAPRAQARKSETVTSSDEARETKNKAVETRSTGGKTFRRADGVWYDSAYTGQAATNVRRGSSEYQKLDSGLRAVAGSLGGTIVVVWKGKAYRIQ